MNLLFINSIYPDPQVGGVEHMTYDIGNWLAEQGHQVYCLVIGGELPPKKAGAIHCFQLPEKGSWANGENLSEFRLFLKDAQIKVIIVQSEKTQAIDLCELGVPSAIRVITVWHTSPPTQRGGWDDFLTPLLYKYGWFLFLLRFPLEFLRQQRNYRGGSNWELQSLRRRYKRCDAFVTVSQRFHQELIRVGKLGDGTKLVAIPNPVTASSVPDTLPKEKIVIWVGRMTFTPKRPDRMIRIWEKVSPYFPDWSLYMIGEGDARSILEAYCQCRKIPRVFFTGRQNPEEWYQRSSILCLTSSWEAWGLVLTEAMMHRCVPIAYDSYASLRDIITDKHNGMVIPCFSKHKYVDVLKWMMSHPEDLSAMAKNAQEKASSFSLDNIGKMWEHLFAHLVSQEA